MRRVAAAVVLLITLSSAPAADARTRRDCGPRTGETLARSRDMRVYLVYDDVFQTSSYRACWIRTHKAVRLAEFEDDSHFADWLDHFAIAGRYLTFAHMSSWDQEEGTAFHLVLVDVRDRRQVRKGGFGRGEPIKLVVNRRGEVGMLSGFAGSPDRSVVKFDAGGETTLDFGPDLSRLALNGRTLRWTHGDERRTYEFG